jgi:hypothetical protein
LGEFHPNDLDPFLLFDARDSMIGTLENPTLDLDPSKPDTLNVITATRAGTATFTDVNGNIASAPANTVRVDYVDGVPMILVEPAATNLLTNSENISNAAWTKFGAGTGVAPTVTPDFGTSPDGTLSASRVQFNKGSGTSVGDQSVIFDSAQTSSGAITTKSVYLKSNTTESYEMVIYETTDASGTNVKKITVTPDWQRFNVYGAISATTTGITIGLREISVSGLSNIADVLVWGAQVETGSVATSLIPTAGGNAAARTRAADNLEITGSAFSDFYNGSEGTFYVEVVDRQVTGSSHSYIVGQSASQFFLYKDSGSAQITSFDAGTGMNKSPLVANQLMRLALTYKSASPASRSLSLDGSTSDGSYNGNFSSANILKIGGGYSDVFSGYFRRILFWPYHSDNL